MVFIGAVVWILLCILVGRCADRWNRSFGKYIVLSFLLSPLIMGIILLIMGKDDKVKSGNKDEYPIMNRTEKKSPNSGKWKECPMCKRSIDATLTGCPHCGNTNFPQKIIKYNADGTKTCRGCKENVGADWTSCPHCGSEDFE
jgi:RNA polymerase subunit RPABC4/transcription elongation factor Spt4